MKLYRKDVSKRSKKLIKKEVLLQTIASSLGVTPKIVDADYKTHITMENIEEMCIADMYGEDFTTIPDYIIDKIYTILLRLYEECKIQYIDVTPYNFIEKNGEVYIIDFGDAKISKRKNWFIAELLKNKRLIRWNPDFR